MRKHIPGLHSGHQDLDVDILFPRQASHGLLDAMTDGGPGVAFFAPFANRRYFLPWTPIRVSPTFTSRGTAVIRSELFWIWVPAGVLVVSALSRVA